MAFEKKLFNSFFAVCVCLLYVRYVSDAETHRLALFTPENLETSPKVSTVIVSFDKCKSDSAKN